MAENQSNPPGQSSPTGQSSPVGQAGPVGQWLQGAQSTVSGRTSYASPTGGPPHQSSAPSNDLFQQIPELQHSLQSATHAHQALQALGIDWTKIWGLARPQIVGLIQILIQSLLSQGGMGGGGTLTVPGQSSGGQANPYGHQVPPQ